MTVRKTAAGDTIIYFTKSNAEKGTLNIRKDGDKVAYHGAPYAPLDIEQAIALATALVEAVEEIKAGANESE